MVKKKLVKFIPNEYVKKINEINYRSLFEKGFTTLIFDLDNTIADYDTSEPSSDVAALFSRLKEMGFNLFIISNNHKERTSHFIEALGVNGKWGIRKPFTSRMNKFLNEYSINKTNAVMIGDQLMTDLICASKLGIYKILVDSLNPKTEKFYTRFNRLIEKRRLHQIKKYYNEIYISLGLDKRWIMN